MANFVQPEYTTVDGVKYANYKTYSGNRNLKGVGVDVFWTEELRNEYLKCAEDPIYFIEKYVKIVHVDRGIIPFKMWPFQRDLVKCLHENRMVIGKLARQCGKCFSGTTKLKVRNKLTGKVEYVDASEFHNKIKTPKM